MDVLEALKDYITNHSWCDGLYNSDAGCNCHADNLCPCDGEDLSNCELGYVQPADESLPYELQKHDTIGPYRRPIPRD